MDKQLFYMGQEINHSHFSQADFAEFLLRLHQETKLLKQMFKIDAFDQAEPVAGYELESWLIDHKGNPSPSNNEFLNKLNNPEVVAELALFNVELNGPPRNLTNGALSKMQHDLEHRWDACQSVAKSMQLKPLAIGILPTVKADDLCLDNMSQLKRYLALNQQVLRMRQGQPITLDIQGKDSLKHKHADVMLEAATTSFQIHLQLATNKASQYYNLAKIISAPMVAISANSPFLFGKQLWEETRIPLFEQSVAVGGSEHSNRVTFGVHYITESMQEVFDINCERYPVLLPMLMDTPVENLSHLRLHNGTIWRWTRPLVGFNDNGKPHIRIEHRTVSAGPTQTDQIANAAFFFGLITAMAQQGNLEQYIPHKHSKDNFYKAAKYGMHTKVKWLNNKTIDLRKLCLEELVPLAKQGLEILTIDKTDCDKYLAVIKARLKTHQTGAYWQKRWIEKHGKDWQQLVLVYQANQATGHPVHSWNI